jgi:hypothetical protein
MNDKYDIKNLPLRANGALISDIATENNLDRGAIYKRIKVRGILPDCRVYRNKRYFNGYTPKLVKKILEPIQ